MHVPSESTNPEYGRGGEASGGVAREKYSYAAAGVFVRQIIVVSHRKTVCQDTAHDAAEAAAAAAGAVVAAAKGHVHAAAAASSVFLC